ncbi:MAG: FecR domain-containing protein [Pseudomonadota bacterium]
MKKLLCLMLLSMSASPLLAETAGQIGYMSGVMVAQRADGTIRVMAPKSLVQEGDTLVTSSNSYAQVKMNDGTKMTMRPDSNLKIETYRFKKDSPQTDNAVFRLLKGGFRTVTGLIGKRGNPDAYKLRAATATIGIRGTDFTARLCGDKECAGEAAPKPQAPVARPVGRVMLLQGAMAATDTSGKARKLLLGSPVYEGDKLNTDVQSHAVVAFRDESRITLQQSSIFFVEKFKFDKASKQESAILRLLKGGVRVVTGLIGRTNHDNYRFGVAGATIGIRGTGFDAWCNGACASGGNPGANSDNPLDGAGVYVWSGAVVFITPDGSVDVALQQAAIIARATGKPVPIVVVPKSIIENGAPRPDSVPVDFEKEFGGDGTDGRGLYVSVHDGKVIVSLDGKQLELGTGENGFSRGADLLRLSRTPAFMLDGGNDGDGGGGNPGGCVVQ